MRFVLALVVGFFTLSVAAQDLPVTFGEGVEGRLMLPDAPTDRAVLLLHGWNGSMDEVGNLYKDLALSLKARGIASLRFNFSGEGERVGYVVTSTLDSRLRESRAALETLRARVPNARYGVVGFSLGGLTAMAMLAEQPEVFDSLVLWSAAQEIRLSGDEGYNRAMREAVATGRGIYSTYADITLTRDYVLSFLGVNASVNLSKFDGALLAIRGDQDYLPAHDPAWLQRAPGTDKAFLLIGGADHIFNVLASPRPNYGDRVIRASADWLARTLD